MERCAFPLINDVYQLCIGWVKNDHVSKSYDDDNDDLS